MFEWISARVVRERPENLRRNRRACVRAPDREKLNRQSGLAANEPVNRCTAPGQTRPVFSLSHSLCPLRSTVTGTRAPARKHVRPSVR